MSARTKCSVRGGIVATSELDSVHDGHRSGDLLLERQTSVKLRVSLYASQAPNWLDILTQQNQLLAPAYRPITEFMVKTYTWDRFITAGVAANLCALVWLCVLAFPRPAGSLRPEGATRLTSASN